MKVTSGAGSESSADGHGSVLLKQLSQIVGVGKRGF